MSHLTLTFCVHNLVAQFEPATQLLWSLVDRTRPATAGEGTFYVSELLVLPKDKQRHRSFRESQLEIAGAREADKRLADDGRFRSAIKKLAVACLPITRRRHELVSGSGRAACEPDCE